MSIILWDASGLVKRYGREIGSETVDATFQSSDVDQMATTLWGYAECVAILHRKRNDRLIDAAAYSAAVTALQQEVLVSSDFKTLTIEDDRVLAGLAFVVRHNLNSNDAAILATCLRYQQSLPPGSPFCILAAADKRLLRAAEAEGLRTLNPEQITPPQVAALLAGAAL